MVRPAERLEQATGSTRFGKAEAQEMRIATILVTYMFRAPDASPMEAVEVGELPAAERITKLVETNRSFYVIEEGAVEITALLNKGEITLRVADLGESLPLPCLSDQSKLVTFAARTMSAVTALRVPRTALSDLLEERPDIGALPSIAPSPRSPCSATPTPQSRYQHRRLGARQRGLLDEPLGRRRVSAFSDCPWVRGDNLILFQILV